MQSGEQTPGTLRFHVCVCVCLYVCFCVCHSVYLECIFMYHVSHLCHKVFLMLEMIPGQLIVAVLTQTYIDVFVSHIFLNKQAQHSFKLCFTHVVQCVHLRFFCLESMIHCTWHPISYHHHCPTKPLTKCWFHSPPKVQSDSAGWLYYACQSQSELGPID